MGSLLKFVVMAKKVSKFQNVFMKSSFLPKYEPNILRISALYSGTLQGNFWFIFWEKRCLHEFILKFTDLYNLLSPVDTIKAVMPEGEKHWGCQ